YLLGRRCRIFFNTKNGFVARTECDGQVLLSAISEDPKDHPLTGLADNEAGKPILSIAACQLHLMDRYAVHGEYYVPNAKAGVRACKGNGAPVFCAPSPDINDSQRAVCATEPIARITKDLFERRVLGSCDMPPKEIRVAPARRRIDHSDEILGFEASSLFIVLRIESAHDVIEPAAPVRVV